MSPDRDRLLRLRPDTLTWLEVEGEVVALDTRTSTYPGDRRDRATGSVTAIAGRIARRGRMRETRRTARAAVHEVSEGAPELVPSGGQREREEFFERVLQEGNA